MDLGDECLIQTRKDDVDLKILNEFAKKMRDEHPNMSVVQTPLCEYTLTLIKKGKIDQRHPEYSTSDYVAIKWEIIGNVRTPQDIQKLHHIAPFIIFDTVDEFSGFQTEYSSDMIDPRYEFYETKSGGVGVRKQATRTVSQIRTRKSKRLMCDFYVDPRIKQYIESVPGNHIVGVLGHLFNITFDYVCHTPPKGITLLPPRTAISTVV